jgi:hypothetical protein
MRRPRRIHVCQGMRAQTGMWFTLLHSGVSRRRMPAVRRARKTPHLSVRQTEPYSFGIGSSALVCRSRTPGRLVRRYVRQTVAWLRTSSYVSAKVSHGRVCERSTVHLWGHPSRYSTPQPSSTMLRVSFQDYLSCTAASSVPISPMTVFLMSVCLCAIDHQMLVAKRCRCGHMAAKAVLCSAPPPICESKCANMRHVSESRAMAAITFRIYSNSVSFTSILFSSVRKLYFSLKCGQNVLSLSFLPILLSHMRIELRAERAADTRANASAVRLLPQSRQRCRRRRRIWRRRCCSLRFPDPAHHQRRRRRRRPLTLLSSSVRHAKRSATAACRVPTTTSARRSATQARLVEWREAGSP